MILSIIFCSVVVYFIYKIYYSGPLNPGDLVILDPLFNKNFNGTKLSSSRAIFVEKIKENCDYATLHHYKYVFFVLEENVKIHTWAYEHKVFPTELFNKDKTYLFNFGHIEYYIKKET